MPRPRLTKANRIIFPESRSIQKIIRLPRSLFWLYNTTKTLPEFTNTAAVQRLSWRRHKGSHRYELEDALKLIDNF